MYKKAFARRLKNNKFLIHLWDDQGYQKVEWDNKAYIECHEADAQYTGLNGEPLKKITNWKPDNSKLQLKSMVLMMNHQLLIEKYFLILRLKWVMLLQRNILNLHLKK